MSVSVDNLLIDTGFDADLAERLAQLESFNKHHFRPNTYLHKWWGRRCGSTFRMILKGLVDDESLRPYYAPGGLEGKVILDPMIGGGTTLHEAIRMGANVVGADIDPIPVLQARATLTDVPLPRLQAAFERFFNKISDAAGDRYMTLCPECHASVPFWYALYGLRRLCQCGQVIVVDSLTIRQQPDGTLVRLCPFCAGLTSGDNHDCPERGRRRIIAKTERSCPDCKEPYRDIHDRPYYARYQMLLIAGHCPRDGLFYRSPDPADHARRDSADTQRGGLPFDESDFGIGGGDKSIQLRRRRINSYLELFASRQLAFIHGAIAALPDDDPNVRLILALLVSTSLEFNSMLCGYKGVARRRAGAVRHAFSHHGYAFPYTALEVNPVYPRPASGSLRKLFEARVKRGRSWASAPRERRIGEDGPAFLTIAGELDCGTEVSSASQLAEGARRFRLYQGSAAQLPIADQSVDAVVTDPPYFDSIQYADLAEYFRVWLRRMVPDEAEWTLDASAIAVNSERDIHDGQYVATMSDIFRECSRVLKPGKGRLVFTYHHWRPRAWAAISIALRRAGFELLNRYVVHAEHPMSVHINNMRALTHDAILILARMDDMPRRAWEAPEGVWPTESQQFTTSCATLLGWVLAQKDLTEAATERIWYDALSRGPSTAALASGNHQNGRASDSALL